MNDAAAILGGLHVTNNTITNNNSLGANSISAEALWFGINRYSNNGLSRLVADFPEATHFQEILARDGILIVSSRLRSVAAAAADRILNVAAGQMPALSPYYMPFTGFEKIPFSALLESPERIGESAKLARDGGKDILLLVDADGSAATDGLRDGVAAFLHTDQLKGRQIYVLIVAGGESAFRTAWPQRLVNWTVPPLPALLAHHGMSNLEARLQKISDTKSRNREQKEQLLDAVQNCLTTQPDGLPGLVAEWETGGFAPWLRKTAREDLPESPAERAALFLGAFFPDVPFVQFDRLMQLILINEKEPVSAPTMEKERPADPELSLDRWNRNSRRVLRSVDLEPVEDENGQRIVSFTDPGMAVAIRSNFPDDRYLLDQIRRLHESGAMLDADTLDATADALASTISLMTKWYSDKFNENWILEVFQAAVKREAAKHEKSLRERFEKASETDNPLTHVRVLLELLEEAADETGRGLSDILFERLKQLCLAQGDVKLVERFLEKLIVVYSDNPRVPLKLIARLRKSDKLDPLEWLRRLMEIGDDDALLHVWRLLKDECRSTLECESAVMKQVFFWAHSQPSENLLAQRAISFLYDWVQTVSANSRYFSAEGWQDRIDLLFRWMTHPFFSSSLTAITGRLGFEPKAWANRRGQSSIPIIDLILAEMIETLYYHPGHTQAVALLGRRLREEWAQSNPARRANIHRLYENYVRELDALISRTPGEEGIRSRSKLNRRKERVLELLALI